MAHHHVDQYSKPSISPNLEPQKLGAKLTDPLVSSELALPRNRPVSDYVIEHTKTREYQQETLPARIRTPKEDQHPRCSRLPEVSTDQCFGPTPPLPRMERKSPMRSKRQCPTLAVQRYSTRIGPQRLRSLRCRTDTSSSSDPQPEPSQPAVRPAY